MNTRHQIITGCTAAIIAAAGVTSGVVAAAAAPNTPTMHRIHLISYQTGTHQFGRHNAAASGIDRRHGKVVGYDSLHLKFTKTGGAINGAVVLSRGLLYFRIPFSNGPVQTGKITGGAVAFKGVTGTIAAKNLNKAGTKTAVTITYHH